MASPIWAEEGTDSEGGRVHAGHFSVTLVPGRAPPCSAAAAASAATDPAASAQGCRGGATGRPIGRTPSCWSSGSCARATEQSIPSAAAAASAGPAPEAGGIAPLPSGRPPAEPLSLSLGGAQGLPKGHAPLRRAFARGLSSAGRPQRRRARAQRPDRARGGWGGGGPGDWGGPDRLAAPCADSDGTGRT